MNNRWRQAVVGVAVLALLGCSSGVPDGWREADVGGLSFQYPVALDADVPELLGSLWSFGVADDEDPVEAYRIVRATDHLGEDFWAASGAGRLVANHQLRLPGFRTYGEDDITVDGASSAKRVRFSYEADDGRQVDGVWFVVTDLAQRRSAAVEVVGRNLDEETVRQIQASLRWRPARLPDAPGARDDATGA